MKVSNARLCNSSVDQFHVFKLAQFSKMGEASVGDLSVIEYQMVESFEFAEMCEAIVTDLRAGQVERVKFRQSRKCLNSGTRESFATFEAQEADVSKTRKTLQICVSDLLVCIARETKMNGINITKGFIPQYEPHRRRPRLGILTIVNSAPQSLNCLDRSFLLSRLLLLKGNIPTRPKADQRQDHQHRKQAELVPAAFEGAGHGISLLGYENNTKAPGITSTLKRMGISPIVLTRMGSFAADFFGFVAFAQPLG